jgi:hypothetical protein
MLKGTSRLSSAEEDDTVQSDAVRFAGVDASSSVVKLAPAGP